MLSIIKSVLTSVLFDVNIGLQLSLSLHYKYLSNDQMSEFGLINSSRWNWELGRENQECKIWTIC